MRNKALIISILLSCMILACGNNESSLEDYVANSTVSGISNSESPVVAGTNSTVDSSTIDVVLESSASEVSDVSETNTSQNDVPAVGANEIVLQGSLFALDWRNTPYTVTIPDVDNSIKDVTIRHGRFSIRDSGGISYDVTTYEGLRGHGLFKMEIYGNEASPLDSDDFIKALATILARIELSDDEVVPKTVDSLYMYGSSNVENIEMQLDKEKNTFLLVNTIALPDETIIDNSVDEVVSVAPITAGDYVVEMPNDKRTWDIWEDMIKNDYMYTYIFYNPNVDPNVEDVVLTRRNIRLGDSIEKVEAAYGKADVKKYDFSHDMVCDDLEYDYPDGAALLKEQCDHYLNYVSDEAGSIKFLFNNNDELAWIIFYYYQ